MAQQTPEGGARGIDRWMPLALVLLFIVALGGGIVLLTQRGNTVIVEEVATPTPAPVTMIKAYITGAVKKPGVYEFTEGKRLVDLLEKAKPLLEDADTSRLNMALRLQDEGHYYIPTVGETPPAPFPSANGSQSATASGSPSDCVSADGRLDLNTASAAQLETLPGIGPTRADAIIAYRQQTPFKRVEDLPLVRGVGQGTLDAIEGQVTVC